MKRYILVGALLAAVVPAAAQNLNPTVEVTRSYEGKIIESEKQSVGMDVPDSLMRFDLDFDYSVFTKNYAGAADFSPYLMEMRPAPQQDGGGKMYLRFGAGYTLRPTLDFVYSPSLKGRTELNIYANHRSYFGKYHEIIPSINSDGIVVLDPGDETASGYDMSNRAGIDGRYIYGEGVLTFSAGYNGINTSNPYAIITQAYSGADGYYGIQYLPGESNTALHSGEASLRLRHFERDGNFFFYDASLKGRFGSESFSTGEDNLVLGNVVFDGTFGPVFARYNRIVARTYVGINTYSGLFDATTGNIWVAPRYQFERKGWLISAGLKIGGAFRRYDDDYNNIVGKTSGQIFYPDFHFRFAAVPDHLSLYLDIEGGVHENSYYSQKGRNHFIATSYHYDGYKPFIDNTVENVRATVGIEGNIASKLDFNLRGGAAVIENGLLDGIADVYVFSYPKVVYENYNMAFAGLDFAYASRSLLVDGSLDYKFTNLVDKKRLAIAPAALSGNIRMRYGWNGRIYGGVYADFASARKGLFRDSWMMNSSNSYSWISGQTVRIPGWVDLGLTGEYAITRRLSFWAQAGNILGMKIQRTPGVAEKGVSVIGGIILSL